MLAGCGEQQGEINGQGICPEKRAIAETEFSEDDGTSERLFSVVVGGWHAVNIEKGEEVWRIAFGLRKAAAEVLCIGFGEWLATNPTECALKSWEVLACA